MVLSQSLGYLCRELPVTPMMPRFSRASIPSQTVMPCNLVSWSESSGLIFNQSKCKYQCITSKKSPVHKLGYLYYQRNAFGILRYRERPWCVGVKQSYLGQTSDWTVCESQQTPRFLGTSKAPKRVVHFIFLSSGAISATQPKYGRHSPLAY